MTEKLIIRYVKDTTYTMPYISPVHVANELYRDIMSVINPQAINDIHDSSYRINLFTQDESDFYLQVEVNYDGGLGKMCLVESNPPNADVKTMEVTLSVYIDEAKQQQRQFLVNLENG
jgi:hypothetical protein